MSREGSPQAQSAPLLLRARARLGCRCSSAGPRRSASSSGRGGVSSRAPLWCLRRGSGRGGPPRRLSREGSARAVFRASAVALYVVAEAKSWSTPKPAPSPPRPRRCKLSGWSSLAPPRCPAADLGHLQPCAEHNVGLLPEHELSGKRSPFVTLRHASTSQTTHDT